MGEINNLNVEIGDTVQIINMLGEPHMCGKTGVVTHIDSVGQLHGTWSGLAIIPEEDIIKVIKKEREL